MPLSCDTYILRGGLDIVTALSASLMPLFCGAEQLLRSIGCHSSWLRQQWATDQDLCEAAQYRRILQYIFHRQYTLGHHRFEDARHDFPVRVALKFDDSIGVVGCRVLPPVRLLPRSRFP